MCARECVYMCVLEISNQIGVRGNAQCAGSQPTTNSAQLQVLEAWHTIYKHKHTQYDNTGVNNQNSMVRNEIFIGNKTSFYSLLKNEFSTVAYCNMTISSGTRMCPSNNKLCRY